MIASSIETFGVTSSSRVLQAASLSFDASVLEIFMTLLGGATLYPVSRDVAASGADLAEMLRECAITTMAVTPSLLDLIPDGEYPALCTVIVGGEACGAETAARWSRGRQLFNAYAPTEATVYTTAALCAAGQRRTPPLGRPISNMRVYLLDSNLQPVPVGVPGEIHVGGVGLARGYLNRPGLTAAAFVPDPFSGEPGARLYRTGDLARFLKGGEIEFTGRTDSQVKVRGFRIELGEIETVLGWHPGVREAVVVVREDAPGGKRLVAYVVAREETPPTAGEMRDYLKRSLPEYMLPSTFVVLDELPLTPTGKLDRSVLPAPEQARPDLAQDYVAARTALEEVLCRFFSEVLQLERVGVRDSFFELGGHSLLATQVASRVRESLRVELPLRRLFEAPSVEGLAAAILEREAGRERVERTAELLLKLSALSDEEAAKLITEGEGAKLIAEPAGLRGKEPGR